MNTKTAILAAAVGLALASAASGQTVIRLTGSTAFRSTVHSKIISLLTANNGTVTYGYTGTATAGLGSAGQAIFTGKLNGTDVIIKTSFSGSGAGIRDVAQGNNVGFLPNSTTQSSSGTAGAAAGTENGVPDMAMSDVFQASTIFTTPSLTDVQVAVVPFVWVANPSTPNTFTNLTPGQVQNLYANGSLPLALFTGLHADETKNVYALGRDPESGTRITVLAESGSGAFANVVQNQVTVTSGAITNRVVWPAGAFATGNGGYSSGGDLRGALLATSTDGSYVGYLGITDANTAANGGARFLSWNGVPFSPTAIQEGQYTLWGYEHLFYNQLSGIKQTFADTLANSIMADPGASGIALGSMQVSRQSDGSPVGNNY